MNLANIFKYILEGLAVAVAAYFIPQRKTEPVEILSIAVTAAATFMVLDLFAPSVGTGARQGSGFGIGLNQVGWQAGGADDADDVDGEDAEATEEEDASNEDEDDDSQDAKTPKQKKQNK